MKALRAQSGQTISPILLWHPFINLSTQRPRLVHLVTISFLYLLPLGLHLALRLMHALIPKVSSSRTGPIGQESLCLKPRVAAISDPVQTLHQVLETVHGSTAQRESKFSWWIHFKILRSWAKVGTRSRSTMFLKWQVSHWFLVIL